jgi:hypothetical protein
LPRRRSSRESPRAPWPRQGQECRSSSIPISASNHRPNFRKASYDKLVATETPLTGLLRHVLGLVFQKDPGRRMSMFDEVAVASLIDPTLVKTREM